MDLVSSLGYRGQQIYFVDNDKFVFYNGNNLCIYTSSRPTELLTRQDNGVAAISSHLASRLIAVAPCDVNCPVEIISYPSLSKVTTLYVEIDVLLVFLSFSRNGEYLMSLSSERDRRLFIWKLSISRPYLCVSIPTTFQQAYSNPTRHTQIILTGSRSLSLVEIVDTLGACTLVPRRLTIDETIVELWKCVDDLKGHYVYECEGTDMNLTKNDMLACCVWAPVNLNYLIMKSGRLLELDAMIGHMTFLGSLSFGEEFGSDSVVVTSSTLTLTHLIIGLSNGTLCWYDTKAIESSRGKYNIFYPSCTKKLLKSAVSTLAIDPRFERIVVGAIDGEILYTELDIPVNKENSVMEDIDATSTVLGTEYSESVLASGKSDIQSGIVLATASFSLPIVCMTASSAAKKTGNLQYYFVTGSHKGQLTLWRQPSVDSETLVEGAGIRKTALKALTVAKNFETSDKSSVTSLLCLSGSVRDGSVILAVGTSKGHVEFIRLDAVEIEDEMDSEDEDSTQERATDLVKLCTSRMSLIHLFNSAVSILARPEEGHSLLQTQPGILVAGSFFHSTLYLLRPTFSLLSNAGQTSIPGSYEPIITISLDSTLNLNPTVVWWTQDALTIGTHSGTILSYCVNNTNQSIFDKIPCANSIDNSTQASKTLTPSIVWQLSADGVDEGLVAGAGCRLSNSCVAIYSSNSNGIRIFKSSATMLTQIPTADSINSISTCCDNITICTISPNNKYMVTGHSNGQLTIYTTLAPNGHPKIISQVTLHSLPVISVTFSSDSSQLLSCSADGSIFICSVDRFHRQSYEYETAKHSIRDKKFLRSVDSNSPSNLKPEKEIWDEKQRMNRESELKSQYADKEGDLRNRVKSIRVQLETILQAQQSAKIMDQLDPEELVVDLTSKSKIYQENMDHNSSVADHYRYFILKEELSAARIRDETIATMCTPLEEISQFQAAECLKVSSFGLVKYSELEMSQLRKTKQLRAIELRSILMQPKLCNYSDSKLPRLPWLLFSEESGVFGNRGSNFEIEKAIPVDLSSSKGNERFSRFEDGVDLHQQLEQISSHVPELLLYSPLQIHTSTQKRTQIMLLSEIINSTKKRFNQKFQSLLSLREETLSAVETRNTRIREIDALIDTEKTQNLISDTPSLHAAVFDSSVLNVNSELMLSVQVDKTELDVNQVNDKSQSNNQLPSVTARALEEMMHGSLHVKRDLNAETSSLAKPDWMTKTDPTDMTEEQRKEYLQYQQRCKELEEDQMKYRHQLDLENKRLRSENVDSLRIFDEKIAELLEHKVKVLREIASIELYVATIAHNLTNTEKARRSIKMLENQMRSRIGACMAVRTQANNVKTQIDEQRLQLHMLQEEEKTMERTFRRDIQNQCNATLDQADLKQITKMYKIRHFLTDPNESESEDEDYDSSDRGSESSRNYNSFTKMDGKSASTKGSKHKSRKVEGLGSSRDNRKSNNSSRNRSRSRLVSSRDGKSSKRGDSKQPAHHSKRAAQSFRRSSGSQLGKSGQVGNDYKSSSGKFGKSGQQSSINSSRRNSGATRLGPMQEAAMAMNATETPLYDDRDPFFLALQRIEKQKLKDQCRIPLRSQLTMDDSPDGFILTQFILSVLQELRNKRINKEIESRSLALSLHELSNKFDTLTSEDAFHTKAIDNLKAQRDKELNRLTELQDDKVLLVSLRQGQDEVTRGAVLPSYIECVLVPTAVPAKFNSRITELGNKYLQLLTRMMKFRGKICVVDWETQRLSLRAQHLSEYFTDLQLFRVTRSLQKVLREGCSNADTKKRIQKAIERQSFIKLGANIKIASLCQTQKKLREKLIRSQEELTALEQEISQLRRSADDHAMIKHALEPTGINGYLDSDEDLAMKFAAARSQLFNQIKVQTEEINELQRELEKMRQRTFPTFAKSARALSHTII